MCRDFSENLPIEFKQIVSAMPHFNGKKWLEELPKIIKQVEKKWSIRVCTHYPNLSYNYVAPCILSDGIEAVLKIGLPQEDSEIFDEARALKLLGGNGAVKLLEFDEELEILLLEKVNPGENLREVFENNKPEAVNVAIDLLKRIIQNPPNDCGLQPLETWFENFQRARRKTPFVPFEEAAMLLEKLNSDKAEKYILHADFHHENILTSDREGFLVIDPKGMLGNIGYEISVFLNNHAMWLKDESNLGKNLKAAVRKFSKAFDISENELKDWAYFQQVLATFWGFEDTRQWDQRSFDFASIWKAL